MIRPTVVILAAALALAAAPAVAQEGEVPSVIPPRQVFSIQPVHAILGWYSAEYERVVAPTTTIGVTGAYFDWEGESTYVSAEGTLRYYPSADALDGLAFGMTLGPTFVTDRETYYYYYGVAVEPIPYDVVPPMTQREHFRAIGFGFEISRSHILGVERRFHWAYGAGAKRLIRVSGDAGNASMVIPMARLSVGFSF
jgi:hypothetical protein